MVSGARDSRELSDAGVVLDVLDDEVSRTIIEELDEPMTVSEIAAACDLPVSTVYRALDELTGASLLATGTKVHDEGHHVTTYRVDFEAVTLLLDESHSLDVSVVRPRKSVALQLADLWSALRRRR